MSQNIVMLTIGLLALGVALMSGILLGISLVITKGRRDIGYWNYVKTIVITLVISIPLTIVSLTGGLSEYEKHIDIYSLDKNNTTQFVIGRDNRQGVPSYIVLVEDDLPDSTKEFPISTNNITIVKTDDSTPRVVYIKEKWEDVQVILYVPTSYTFKIL